MSKQRQVVGVFLGDKSVLCEETHLFLSHLGFLDTLTILPLPLAWRHEVICSKDLFEIFSSFFSTLRGGLDLTDREVAASGLTRLMIYIEEEMVTLGANYDYPSVFLVLRCSTFALQLAPSSKRRRRRKEVSMMMMAKKSFRSLMMRTDSPVPLLP